MTFHSDGFRVLLAEALRNGIVTEREVSDLCDASPEAVRRWSVGVDLPTMPVRDLVETLILRRVSEKASQAGKPMPEDKLMKSIFGKE